METNAIYTCKFCEKVCKNPGSLVRHKNSCKLNPIHYNKVFEVKSIFLDNKYTNLYFKIIKSALKNYYINDGYFEQHHILPKSLNGSDNKNNIIKLTPRQHFICHYLLTKMFDLTDYRYKKMIIAFNMMISGSSIMNRYINSNLYKKTKLQYANVISELQSGTKNSQFGKIWITNPLIKENKSINKTDTIPSGWFTGRCNYLKTHPMVYNNGVVEKLFYKFNIEDNFIKGKLKYKIENTKKIEKVNMIHLDWQFILYVYNNYGFSSVKILCNIDFKSRNNLMIQSKRYNKSHFSNQKTKNNTTIVSFKMID